MYRVTNHGGGSDGSGKNKFRVEMRVACSVRNTAEHGHESRSRRKPDADADADLLPGCSSALVNVHLKIVGRWWRWVGIHGFASMKNGNTFALIKPIYKPGPQPAT